MKWNTLNSFWVGEQGFLMVRCYPYLEQIDDTWLYISPIVFNVN